MIACPWSHIYLFMVFPLLVKGKAHKYTYMYICPHSYVLHEAVHLCTVHSNVLVNSSVNLLVSFENTKTKYIMYTIKHPWRVGGVKF